MWIYLLGILQEYLVILNIYNANLIPYIPIDIQYSIPDIIMLISLLVTNRKNYIDIICISLALFAHIQWYLHSPFTHWPDWWISEKSADDIRHRTEYYDTHVMCFTIYSILFYRYLRIKELY